MTTFSSRTRAEATVAASRADIWKALVDPELMSRLTPFLRRITADGDRWCWSMSGIEVLGAKLAPSFTERMTFDEPARIDFRHEPPKGTRERAGVEGWYDLTEVSDGRVGTRLVTEMEVCVDLPLPRAAGPAVRATMKRVIDTMGDRFSRNLLAHLGAEQLT